VFSRFAFGKGIAKNLCLVTLAIIILLAVLEAALAMSKFNTPANARFVPSKGFTYIPHSYYRHTKEGYSEGRFNSHGFRDYERTYEKPPGVFRILVLGDSYIEALQVQLEDSFTALLEKSLIAQGSSTRFEVIGLGESGFGTADEYLRYLNFGVAYHPDLVILAFTTGNDFRNNSKALNREGISFYYEFDERHNLVLDRSLIDAYEKSMTYPKQLFQELKTKSHLLALVSERVYLLRRQLLEASLAQVQKGESAGGGNLRRLDVFSDLNIYQSDLPPLWKEAVEITKGIIVKFKRSVEQNGSKFLLISLSNAEQVHFEVGTELEKQYQTKLDYEQADRFLQECAIEHNMQFLKLTPPFREYHRRTGEYLHGFGTSHQGHWNRAGHRLAAQLTFEFLKEQHLVPLDVYQQ